MESSWKPPLEGSFLVRGPRDAHVLASLWSKHAMKGPSRFRGCELEASPHGSLGQEETRGDGGRLGRGGRLSQPKTPLHTTACFHTKYLSQPLPDFSKYKRNNSGGRVQPRFLGKKHGKFYFPLL